MSFVAQKSTQKPFITLCICLLAAVLLQAVLLLTCYEPEIGLYRYGFPTGILTIGYLAAALIVLSVVVFLPFAGIHKQAPDCLRVCRPCRSAAAEVLALLTAVAIAATLIAQLVNLYAYDPLSDLLLDPSESNSTAHFMHLASLVLALPATAHFIALFAGKKTTYPLLLTLLWTCAYMLRVYFDSSVLLMSPIRQLTLVALVTVVLFLIAELRLARSVCTPLFYSVCAALAAFFAALSGVSGLLLTAIGYLPASTETAYYAFQLVIALLALFRVRAVMIPLFDACNATQIKKAGLSAERAEQEAL